MARSTSPSSVCHGAAGRPVNVCLLRDRPMNSLRRQALAARLSRRLPQLSEYAMNDKARNEDGQRTGEAPYETLEQAAHRLEIVAGDLRRRFQGNECVMPIAAPNSIKAIRMILDRLEGECSGEAKTSEGSSTGKAAGGSGPATSADAGSKPAPPTNDPIQQWDEALSKLKAPTFLNVERTEDTERKSGISVDRRERATLAWPETNYTRDEGDIIGRVCILLSKVWEHFDPHAHDSNDCFCKARRMHPASFRHSQQSIAWLEKLVERELGSPSSGTPEGEKR